LGLVGIFAASALISQKIHAAFPGDSIGGEDASEFSN
jgi:hypothetical protein